MVKNFQRIIFILISTLLPAQEDHQRLGVQKDTAYEVLLGLDGSETFNGPSWSGLLSPSLDFILDQTWAAGLSWPLQAQYIYNLESDEFKWKFASANVSLERKFTSNSSRNSLGLGWEFPWEEGKFHRFSLSGQVSSISDPVILALALRLESTLPIEMEGTLWWQPLQAMVNLSLTEVINSQIGWSVSLSPGVSTAPQPFPLESRTVFYYSLNLAFQVFYDRTDWNTKVG